jgi:hypothetical protein
MSTDTRTTAPHHFIVAGISLKSIRRVLKPALPKKRQEASCIVVITATTTNSVKVAIDGAQVELPAIASGSFVAEIPYLYLKGYLTYPYENGALLRCELAAGSFSVDGIATKSPQILLKSSDGGAAAA